MRIIGAYNTRLQKERQQQMKTLLTVLLSATSLTILFGSPNPQGEPEVSVPGIVSTSRDNGGMLATADFVSLHGHKQL